MTHPRWRFAMFTDTFIGKPNVTQHEELKPSSSSLSGTKARITLHGTRRSVASPVARPPLASFACGYARGSSTPRLRNHGRERPYPTAPLEVSLIRDRGECEQLPNHALVRDSFWRLRVRPVQVGGTVGSRLSIGACAQKKAIE